MKGKSKSAAGWRNVALLPVSFITALLPVYAGAATTEEIVVTTRRSAENLQEVPVAVSAFTEDFIEKQAISSTADVVKLVPGVQFDQSFSAADTRISIRGINSSRGRTSAAVLIDGIDVTGENVTSGGGSALLNTRLLELERVEVVKGPQSALFGRNAFAGAIKYYSKQPSLEQFESKVSAELAQNDTYDLRAWMSAPVIEDTLAIGFNVGAYSTDGFYENNNPSNPAANVDLGGSESVGARLSAIWNISDALTMTGAVSYSDTESDPRAVAKVGPANQFYLMGSAIPQDSPFGSMPFDSSSGLQDYGQYMGTIGSVDKNDINLSISERTGEPFKGSDDEVLLAYVKFDWDVAGMLFKSSTSYLDAESTLNEDVDFQDGLGSQAFAFAPPPFTSNVFLSLQNEYEDATDTTQFTQEFTLESDDWEYGNWLVGVSGFWEDVDNSDTSLNWFNDPAFPTDPALGIFCGTIPEFNQVTCGFPAALAVGLPAKTTARDTQSLSIFALVGIDLSDTLRLTLEGRYIDDEIEVETNTAVSRVDQTLLNYPIDGSLGPNPAIPLPAKDKVSSSTFNPRVALDYRMTDEMMFYGSVAKGTKPAGFATTQFSTPARSRVEEETLWAYEVGAKTLWLEGALKANVALFFNDYEDRQVGITTFDPFPASGVANAAGAETKGVEVDLVWRPIEPLTLAAAYAYTNAEYTDFNFAEIRAASGATVRPKDMAICGNTEGNCDGAEIGGIPEHAASLLFNWTAPVAANMDWFVNAIGTYTDKRPVSDQVNTAFIDSSFKVDVQLGLQTEVWLFEVFADNLFDDDTPLWGQSSNDFRDGVYNTAQPRDDTVFVFLPPQRQFGVRATYRF